MAQSVPYFVEGVLLYFETYVIFCKSIKYLWYNLHFLQHRLQFFHVSREDEPSLEMRAAVPGDLVTSPQSPTGASLNIFPIRTLGQCRSVAPAALFYPNSELKSAPISWTIWTVTQMLKPVGALQFCYVFIILLYNTTSLPRPRNLWKSFPKKNQNLNPYQCIANQCKIWSVYILCSHL